MRRLLLFSLAWLPLLGAAQRPASSRPANPARPATDPLLTPYERSGGRETATHSQAVAFYQALAARYPQLVQVHEAGPTDVGRPLHAVVLSGRGAFTPAAAQAAGLPVVLVVNAIHPGEPEGVDASMLIARGLCEEKALHPLLDQVVLVVLPMYNIGGALNRGRPSRANQDGPVAYGFRGNARNLDLNRDFIKTDSRNAQSFQALFRAWQPHVLLDNHTSNGADYPYVMTLLTSMRDKLHPSLRNWLHTHLLPGLHRRMAAAQFPMVPYMNTLGETPESGIAEFYDSPRYSSGYAALFNCVGLVAETHMLKPFAQRMQATYELMAAVLRETAADGPALVARKRAADASLAQQARFVLHWALDTTRTVPLRFNGYTATRRESQVSGLPRLYYDRERPWTRDIPYYPHYLPTADAYRPAAYVLPQAWHEVAERLQRNGVRMRRFAADTTLRLPMAYVRDYQTVPRPYEGHYLHRNVQVSWEVVPMQVFAGDWYVPTDATQDAAAIRYLVEVLEPNAPDSFFAWGFFDSVLQQKEYFSAYVFEDKAAELLRRNPSLRSLLDGRIEGALAAGDSTLARSAQGQLDFVYRNSDYYEPTHNRYPVARVNEALPAVLFRD